MENINEKIDKYLGEVFEPKPIEVNTKNLVELRKLTLDIVEDSGMITALRWDREKDVVPIEKLLTRIRTNHKKIKKLGEI